MRKINLGKIGGKDQFVTVTPKAKKVAKNMFYRIEEIGKSLEKRFGGSLRVSQEALEDLVAIHGEEAIKGLDEDLALEGLVTAALKGNKQAYEELMGTDKGKLRITQMNIRKPR